MKVVMCGYTNRYNILTKPSYNVGCIILNTSVHKNANELK